MKRLLLALLFLAAPAAAKDPVDVALVLAVDASGSITAEEFALQKEGIVAALTEPRTLAAIRSGVVGRIAVAYVEWGSPAAPATVVGWHLVGTAAEAEKFAATLLAAPRSRQSYNAIGDAIDHGAALLDSCPCEPTRRVIDISGDNRDMRGLRAAPVARDAAVAQGIVVNALAVVEDARRAPDGRPWLVAYFESEVIGGPGAFVEAADSRADFVRAMRRKIVREISGGTVPFDVAR
jgi:hypothetical protein